MISKACGIEVKQRWSNNAKLGIIRSAWSTGTSNCSLYYFILQVITSFLFYYDCNSRKRLIPTNPLVIMFTNILIIVLHLSNLQIVYLKTFLLIIGTTKVSVSLPRTFYMRLWWLEFPIRSTFCLFLYLKRAVFLVEINGIYRNLHKKTLKPCDS